MENRGVQPKDDTSSNSAFMGGNSKRGLELQKWVSDANDVDKDLGRMVAIGVQHSPPVWPGNWSPTGCVDKKKDGVVRLDKKRQTCNLSAPEPGKWLNLLVRSPNETIDLQQDFPRVIYYASAHFMRQVSLLEAIDTRVK